MSEDVYVSETTADKPDGDRDIDSLIHRSANLERKTTFYQLFTAKMISKGEAALRIFAIENRREKFLEMNKY